MSPLLRDELRIMLYADHLFMTRISRKITLQGVTRHVVAKKKFPFFTTMGSESNWEPAMRTLHEALPAMASGPVHVSIILSNHFVRYLVIPGSDALSNLTEEEIYAQQCFKRIYGAAAEQWHIKVDVGPSDRARLASAVDGRLLASLRTVCGETGVSLKSIQPYFIAIYNNCRTKLRESSGWFAVFEPGCLCLALLLNARWSSVRMMRVKSDWREALPVILAREMLLVVADSAPHTVFLWSSEAGGEAQSSLGRWRLINLLKLIPSDCAFGDESLAALPEQL